jgi:hypothetical protein
MWNNCNKNSMVPGSVVGDGAQTIHTHVNECKNNKKQHVPGTKTDMTTNKTAWNTQI